MKYEYDPEVDALSIWFAKGPSVESDEIHDGVIFDYDQNKRLIGIELLNASERLSEKFSKKAVSKKHVTAR